MKRKDIQLISRHSNLSESGVKTALEKHIYSDNTAWKKFLQLLFITLGAGFSVAGVVFFFAYNWADLHKFAKLGLIQGLLIVMMAIVLFSKVSLSIKNILLTATAVLVGVLFAVFGQIYQTGANAYDWFLGWTAAITLWVIISKYAPMWLLYMILLNTTLVLYAEQVAFNWSDIFIFTLLFGLNLLALLVALGLDFYLKKIEVPNWFIYTVALAAVTFATIGLSIAIVDKKMSEAIILIVVSLATYAGGLFYGYQQRKIFYLSIIPFSVIILFAVFIIRLSGDAGSFFLITLFIVGSVTLLIRGLLSLQKMWKN